ncbi:hypothetical protein SLEP1_g33645 [Rubroshorea leprosula]|uniref:Uncharacterized protein n=1 Tax=Rubroshorea leprosula TaxID=152421 RepID=A0AAV5KHB6_9ROSI|nr:hypothetical protein SLEP1_g33645 [Rubroshorea leprosula]
MLLQNDCRISQSQVSLHMIIGKRPHKLEDLSICIAEIGPWIIVRCLQG